MRVLLLEDDRLLGDGLCEGLRDAGFTVDWLTDGESGRSALQDAAAFDVLVLDLGLPRLSGLEVLRGLRAANRNLPVLILTARDAVSDRIAGLDAGADDYLVKPFALGELAARLRALLRREGPRSGLLCWRQLQLDPARQTVTWAGQVLPLTGQEYRILWALLRQYPHLLSRRQLEERLYGWQDGAESNAFEVHLSHLRKKLGQDAIVNVRGLGWRLADAQGAPE